MQNYPTSPEIPSAQQNRRARFASQVAAATSTRFLKALAAFAETEFQDEPLKLKEALSRVACRMGELRGTSDDVQAGEADPNDYNTAAAPKGWNYVTA